MVDRTIPKENRRKAMINLTDNGSEICSTINYSNDSYVQDVMSDFTVTEREEFLRLLGKLTCNMAAKRKE